MTALVFDLETLRRRRAIAHFERFGFVWAEPEGGRYAWGGRSVRCGCGWQSAGYQHSAMALRKLYEHLLEAGR